MRIFKQWILAIALYVALTLDGVLSVYLQPILKYGNGKASLMLLPLAVLVINFEDERNPKEFWLALGAGLVADLYFYGIIGIYIVVLPALSAFGRWYARVSPELFIVRLIGTFLASCGASLYIWLVFHILTWTNQSFQAAVPSVLYTGLWSVGITVLTYWIWSKLARSYPFLIDLDNYRY
ncbi:rod shape-determining protein MreD [Lactobacillus sp.]|uniref:rod shape-determining protein MreD n=1 Tax=Lactobacillus sp. TaxID=1591 RepID=UPI003EF125D3